jgi:hypothetical protein
MRRRKQSSRAELDRFADARDDAGFVVLKRTDRTWSVERRYKPRPRQISNNQANRECLMLRRIGFFALALSFLSSPSAGGETKVAVQLIGIGAMTCAHWRSTAASRAEGTVWIFGFWSGLNYVAAASGQAQASSEEKVVIAEVVRVCATDPSQVLASAAWAAYLNLAEK